MSGLLKRIDRILDENSAERVVSVTIQIGALSHITPDHFREHFERATAGTRSEGARLVIETLDDTGHPHAQDIALLSLDVE
jgi:hydrogenase nickel incorporation protein HypA/HybF